MQIAGTKPLVATLQQQRLEQDHQVQNLFTEILMEAGREGYASAEPLETSGPRTEAIQSTWNDWFNLEMTGRYRGAEQPMELKQQFGELLQRGYQEGAYATPKAFLSSLSKSELEVVQNVHWLAEPPQIESLTEEGALNLMLPPVAQVDVNGDGLTQSGAAYGLRFPDSRTPADVATAWEQATEGMSWGEKAIHVLQIKAPVLLANIVLDANGAYSHSYEPGDPEFVNPLAADDYSYVQVTRDHLASLEYFKNQTDPIHYAKETAFWKNFQQQLLETGAT
ncbi:hypothetical protein [Aureliella helgolandensis]|uniref:Uncharacterized protein n=1 Tax=Aureliella helgolandensis TaxID=2527968 RepID=A0A518G9Z2_9BACT|nr:hypothetical protein [Aureliella helgolandensis]QDV25392.1 hypothetical protein Q31a_37180 [Aureliella helgolandensis]